MNFDCTIILKWTEAQLKYTYDVSLKEATPQQIHEALGEAVMMAISEKWNRAKHTRLHHRKAYYFSAEYLIGRLVYSNLYNLGILDEMKHGGFTDILLSRKAAEFWELCRLHKN